MKFLQGKALSGSIEDLVAGKDVCCAVAFWGSGASALFGKSKGNTRILCNLSSGGTNPDEIEKLMKIAKVRQIDRLHAKVVIGEKTAIVGSANISANGLGFEGEEQAKWIEAAVEIDREESIDEWFEKLWDSGGVIHKSDLEHAKSLWLRRRRTKPSFGSFRDFPVESGAFPFISWFSDESYTYCKENISKQVGYYDSAVESDLDYGIELDHSDDQKAVPQSSWVLCFRITGKSKVDRRANFYWAYTGRLVKDAYRYDGYDDRTYTCCLAASNPPPEPFDANDDKFRRVFIEVIEEEKYRMLRNGEDEHPWFSPRVEHMKELWKDVKAQYDR